MQISTKSQQGISIVEVSGRIDSFTCDQLQNELNNLFSSGSSRIILNLSGVQFISSSGLRVFLSGLKRAKTQNGEMKICCMNSDVEKIFTLAGFDSLFDIASSEEEAVRKFA